jgi:hypothetical protein
MGPFRSCRTTSISSSRSDILTSDGKRGRYVEGSFLRHSYVDGALKVANTAKDAKSWLTSAPYFVIRTPNHVSYSQPQQFCCIKRSRPSMTVLIIILSSLSPIVKNHHAGMRYVAQLDMPGGN